MNVPRTLTPVNLVEVRQVKVDERGGAVDPGDLYDHAESPEALLHGVELSRYGLLGDIRRERCGAPPVPPISLTVASARSTFPVYVTPRRRIRRRPAGRL
jgi:hypothetical protein